MDNGIAFYVGHGRLRRCNAKGKTKTKDWTEVDNQAGGHVVEILHSDLSKEEAEVLELKYLESPPKEWCLVNKRKPVKTIALDPDELLHLFEYDESVPSCLKWRNPARSHLIGKMAGGLQPVGKKKYWVVRIRSKILLLGHRVIFAMLNKRDIGKNMVIDHLDGDGLNNKISNLRETNQSENSINCLKRTSSTGNKYIYSSGDSVRVEIGNQSVGYFSLSFSVSKHGYENALCLAICARDEFLKSRKANGVDNGTYNPPI
jgi:hypothetical protein